MFVSQKIESHGISIHKIKASYTVCTSINDNVYIDPDLINLDSYCDCVLSEYHFKIWGIGESIIPVSDKAESDFTVRVELVVDSDDMIEAFTKRLGVEESDDLTESIMGLRCGYIEDWEYFDEIGRNPFFFAGDGFLVVTINF